jgi:hypothetical protein
MGNQGTTTRSSEAEALQDWKSATSKVSELAASLEASKIDEATFERLREARADERDAWQRCRPHWSE